MDWPLFPMLVLVDGGNCVANRGSALLFCWVYLLIQWVLVMPQMLMEWGYQKTQWGVEHHLGTLVSICTTYVDGLTLVSHACSGRWWWLHGHWGQCTVGSAGCVFQSSEYWWCCRSQWSEVIRRPGGGWNIIWALSWSTVYKSSCMNCKKTATGLEQDCNQLELQLQLQQYQILISCSLTTFGIFCNHKKTGLDWF